MEATSYPRPIDATNPCRLRLAFVRRGSLNQAAGGKSWTVYAKLFTSSRLRIPARCCHVPPCYIVLLDQTTREICRDQRLSRKSCTPLSIHSQVLWAPDDVRALQQPQLKGYFPSSARERSYCQFQGDSRASPVQQVPMNTQTRCVRCDQIALGFANIKCTNGEFTVLKYSLHLNKHPQLIRRGSYPLTMSYTWIQHN